jgi:DNA oxidative demethylase
MFGSGVHYRQGYWSPQAQADVVAQISQAVDTAPFFKPLMPRTGQPWSIWMTNMGSLGWVSDKQGYRYQANHPETNEAWPAIPDILLKAWDELTEYPAPPECCLINYYDQPKAKMGLHQDRDEEDFKAPVLSFSLGDTAVFRMGGDTRKSPTASIKMKSGDALSFGGPARLHFHGIDRILFGSSQLLSEFPKFVQGGRLNLTLRRVSPV